MPKVTHGGASNAQEPEESVAAELPSPPAPSALKSEHVAYATEALGVPADEAESMTKPELTALAQQAQPAQPRRTTDN